MVSPYVPPHRKASNLTRENMAQDEVVSSSSVSDSVSASVATSNFSACPTPHSGSRMVERVISKKEIQEAKKYGKRVLISGDRVSVEYRDLTVIQSTKLSHEIITVYRKNLTGSWEDNWGNYYDISATKDHLLMFCSNSEKIKVGFGVINFQKDSNRITAKVCIGSVFNNPQENDAQVMEFEIYPDYEQMRCDDENISMLRFPDDKKLTFHVPQDIMKECSDQKVSGINGLWKGTTEQNDGMRYLQCCRHIYPNYALFFSITLSQDHKNISSDKWSGDWIEYGFMRIEDNYKMMGQMSKHPITIPSRNENKFRQYKGMRLHHGKIAWCLMEQKGSGSEMYLEHFDGTKYERASKYSNDDIQCSQKENLNIKEMNEIANEFTESGYDNIYLQQQLKMWIYQGNLEQLDHTIGDDPEILTIKVEDHIRNYPERMKFSLVQLAVHYSQPKVLKLLKEKAMEIDKKHDENQNNTLEKILTDRGNFPSFFTLVYTFVISLAYISARKMNENEAAARNQLLDEMEKDEILQREFQRANSGDSSDEEDPEEDDHVHVSPRQILEENIKELESRLRSMKKSWKPKKEKINTMEQVLNVKREILSRIPDN